MDKDDKSSEYKTEHQLEERRLSLNDENLVGNDMVAMSSARRGDPVDDIEGEVKAQRGRLLISV